MLPRFKIQYESYYLNLEKYLCSIFVCFCNIWRLYEENVIWDVMYTWKMKTYLRNWRDWRLLDRNKTNISGWKNASALNNFGSKLQKNLIFLHDFTCFFQRLGEWLCASVTTGTTKRISSVWFYFYCKYDFISLFNSFFYGSSQPQYMLKNKTKNTNSAFKTKIANQEICDICKDNDPAVFSILSPNGKSLIFTPSWYYLQMPLS